jgi:hypothetical protein
MKTHTEYLIEFGGGVFFKKCPVGTEVVPTVRKNGYQLADHAALGLDDWYAPYFIPKKVVEKGNEN